MKRFSYSAVVVFAFSAAACSNTDRVPDDGNSAYSAGSEVNSSPDVQEGSNPHLDAMPADAESAAVLLRSELDDSDEWECQGCD